MIKHPLLRGHSFLPGYSLDASGCLLYLIVAVVQREGGVPVLCGGEYEEKKGWGSQEQWETGNSPVQHNVAEGSGRVEAHCGGHACVLSSVLPLPTCNWKEGLLQFCGGVVFLHGGLDSDSSKSDTTHIHTSTTVLLTSHFHTFDQVGSSKFICYLCFL